MDKIEYRTLNDRAYDRIKDGLMAATFRPGQVLVIRNLAETYGVSTTPVREALQRLVAERLLVLLPNRSIAVPELEAAKYAEILRIRCELEGLAAELAAPRIGAAERHALDGIAAEIDAALLAHDHAAYRRLNQAFHFALYQEAGSPRLLQLIQDLWGQTGPYMNELFGEPAYEPRANEGHRAILAALAKGDPAGARAGVVADLTVAAGYLVPHLEALEALEPA
ncbi:GntR family transcriptional regulator [Aureimonas endophytica]|uniref:GntR family transcriptional regulator n=1 Tax=Aureimonas endophytica TaxID=2027858 RepID=A0A916ZP75_9HYPH|nr:GntR family transcriptional regulator [Aureimonas endophytica]GGE07409.1 GntR family transcriptional regulator [Aureimonas endophytica]